MQFSLSTAAVVTALIAVGTTAQQQVGTPGSVESSDIIEREIAHGVDELRGAGPQVSKKSPASLKARTFGTLFGANPFSAGASPFGSSLFSGAGASPFGGAGASPFGGAGASPFGGAGASPFSGAGASPFSSPISPANGADKLGSPASPGNAGFPVPEPPSSGDIGSKRLFEPSPIAVQNNNQDTPAELDDNRSKKLYGASPIPNQGKTAELGDNGSKLFNASPIPDQGNQDKSSELGNSGSKEPFDSNYVPDPAKGSEDSTGELTNSGDIGNKTPFEANADKFEGLGKMRKVPISKRQKLD